MGENPGTIDASTLFIVLEGAQCPNVSWFSGSIPKTGKLSSNRRVFPEQTDYELLRPVVLFGYPAIQRAKETGEPRTSLERKADDFDSQGMVSLFASRPRKQPQETARSLPPDMRSELSICAWKCRTCPSVRLQKSAIRVFSGVPLIIRSRPCWHLARLHLSRCAAFLPRTIPLILRSVATTLCNSMRKAGLWPVSPSICR